MRAPPPRLLAISIVLGGLLLIAGGWLVHREVSCARWAEDAAHFADAQVRRDATGACYLCREDGWLYDIAFATCSEADPLYEGFKVP
jgi:hypothetical protein